MSNGVTITIYDINAPVIYNNRIKHVNDMKHIEHIIGLEKITSFGIKSYNGYELPKDMEIIQGFLSHNRYTWSHCYVYAWNVYGPYYMWEDFIIQMKEKGAKHV